MAEEHIPTFLASLADDNERQLAQDWIYGTTSDAFWYVPVERATEIRDAATCAYALPSAAELARFDQEDAARREHRMKGWRTRVQTLRADGRNEAADFIENALAEGRLG